MPPDDIFDISLAEGTQLDADITALNALNSVANPATVLALLDELEAKDQRIAVLTESLKQTVSGYKSCLRTGHERILDLGGDCDAPEVMIAGNPDIQQAQKLIAAASGTGIKPPDLIATIACSACHDEIDRRTHFVDAAYAKECALEGMARTQVIWLKEGVIKA